MKNFLKMQNIIYLILIIIIKHKNNFNYFFKCILFYFIYYYQLTFITYFSVIVQIHIFLFLL